MIPLIADLTNVETEHLVGSITKAGLVRLRAESENPAHHVILLGELTPTQAREIATHLFESAARAEYEEDLLQQLTAREFDDDVIASIFQMVRAGEYHRHTKES